MAFYKLWVISGCVSLALGANAALAGGGDPSGVWINDTGRGAIEIKSCGDKLCGHVVWVKDNGDQNGCGKKIIANVRAVGGGRWDNGWIYSPERKKTYDVELYRLDDNRLRVTGYAGMKFLSKTMIWRKAPDDLVRCDAKPAGNPAIEAKADTPGSGAEPGTPVDNAGAQPQQPAAAAVDTNKAGTETTSSAPIAAAAPPAGGTAAQADTQDSAAGTPDATASEPTDVAESDEPPAPRASSGAEFKAAIKEASGIDVDKMFKKTSGGKCKIDLPWVKLTVNCDQ